MSVPTKRCDRCLREGARGFTGRPDFRAGFVCLNEAACSRRVLDRGTPANAVMLPAFTTICDVHGEDGGEHAGEDLNLHTVLFCDGGTVVWFEEPDVLAVWHVVKATGRQPWPTRYRGTWQPCDCRSVGAESQVRGGDAA